jgi:hypothetical protein
VAGGERVERSVEALRSLKPDEAKALMLKAEGLSYDEIGRRFGWTYTKVNRSITEGRARFIKAFRRIEAGDACEPYAEALAAVAAGAATAAQVLELRPHLRHCAACRAAIRELRISRRRPRVALLAPIALLRALRHHAISAYSRISDPTQLAGVRPGAVAAAVAGCIAVGGGATYCVNQHVDPLAALSAFSAPDHHRPRPKPKPKPKPTVRHVKRSHVEHVMAKPPIPTPVASAVPPATPRPTPVATVQAPVATATPQAPAPAPQDEFAPTSPTTTTTTTTHAASPPKPKPAPASGGGNEFGGP